MPQFRQKKRAPKSGGKKGKDDELLVAEEAANAAEEAARAKAQELKAAGNSAFSAGRWEEALAQFSQAIELDPTEHVFWSNRSGTNLQLRRTRDAVSDAEQCVRLSPDWAKGYSRLGAALLADTQGIAAVQAFEKGLKIEPTSEAMQKGLADAKVAALEEEKKVTEERASSAAAPAATFDPSENTVIGIDLGTTYSCVAVWRNGAVEVLEDESGNRTVPSWVAFTPDGGRLVGDAAKNQAAKNTKNTLYDIKRILGQKFSEPKVREEVKRFPFEVLADPDSDDPRIVVEALEGKRLPPEQVSGLLLAYMKRMAETKLGYSVKKAVVTVPAYFNDAQRNATKAAGTIAGLDVLRIINEPTAAALAYGLDKKESGDARAEDGINVLIFDLGGGTFDVSILRIEDGMFNVKATGGDTHLGGEDFDNAVVDDLCSTLKKKHGIDAKSDPRLMRRLRTSCEKAKRALSAGVSAVVEVEDHTLELSRARFEALNKANFERTLDTVRKVMKDAKMEPSNVDDVVLVGGSTRIPRIQEMLSEYFGGRQLCRSINPDEAVAYGAAVQGAILSGVRHQTTDSLVLVDVTPLSLGIELDDKSFSVIIPRNTNIPCKKSDTFTTTENYQESIEIPVYEGERPIASSNRKLGEFSVQNIERAKQGEPKVLVTFELDANGILNITAQDMKTKAKADLRIEGACKGLDPSEVERMVREAEDFAKEDEEYRKQSEMRSDLENLIYDLEESRDGAAAEKVQKCREWLDGVQKLGSPAIGKALRRWLSELGSS